MTPEQLQRVATDARLTSDAVRVILYVDALGPAGEERLVKGEELAILLHGGEKPIRAAIGRAVHCGYLEHAPGGRAGHKLTLLLDGNDARTGGISDPGEPENHAPQGAAFRNDAPQGGIPGAKPLPEGRHFRETTPPGEGFPARGGDYRGGRSSEEEYVDGDTPTSFPLSPQAREAIEQHDPKLAGCRGALVDYLQLRVEPANQRGYVQSIATYLDQPLSHFRQPDGSAVPAELRTARIATALNELAGGDSERKMAAPLGDVRNLRTKLDIVIKQAWEAEHDTGKRSSSGRGARNGRGARPVAGEQRATGTDGRRSGFVIDE